jgi:ABC-type dipeptide/oligopeptide/nickel transport system permease subunit
VQGTDAITIQQALEAEGVSKYKASLWGDAWRRLIRNKLALIGLTVVCLILAVSIFANQLMPYPYAKIFFGDAQLPPSHQFLLGTDLDGRDTLSRLIYGARVSMSVGILTVMISASFGITVGAFAGFHGGRSDILIMRFVDIVYTIPALLLAILLMESLGKSLFHLCIAIGIVSWPTMARLVRGQFLSGREREYIKAARVAGTSDFKIIIRHLLPNALSPIIVAVTFAIPVAIFTEAALSFAGIGINPPTPSWGQMVGQYEVYIQSSPWMSVPPAVAIAITMLAFTFLGDGLRDALDPRMNK